MKKSLRLLSWTVRSFYFRLSGSFLLIIVLLVGAVAFSIFQVNQLSQSYTNLDKLSEAHERSSAIKAYILEESWQFTRLVFLNQTDKLVEASNQSNDDFDTELEGYQSLKLGSSHDNEFITSLKEQDTKHDQLVARILTAVKQGHSEEALAILNGEYTAQIKTMTDLLDGQDKWFDEQKQIERNAASTETSAIQQILTTGGIAITAIALLAALSLTILLGRSVSRLKQGVVALSAGNLQARIAGLGKDELGQVGRAFNAMAERLGELIHNIEGKRRIGLSASQEVNAIASQLSVAATQQSSQASEQSSSLNEVAITLMELRETSSQIAKRATQVASNAQNTFQNMTDLLGLAAQTHQAGEFGQEQVQLSLDNTQQVQGQVSDYDKILSELRTHSEQIGRVISLMKSVADETHLLSLNASIEAAGAGQYGERFKVVASQVKQLADTALGATSEVSLVVKQVQTSIEEASQAMLQTSTRVRQSVASSELVYRSINELNQTLEKMDERYEEVVDLMQGVHVEAEQIKLMTQQQESAIEQVAVTMHQLDSATRETASTSKQLAMTAVQLVDLSGNITTGLAAA